MDNGSGRVRRLLRAEGDPLIRIGWAIGAMLALGVVVAAVVTFIGAQVLDIHGTKSEPLSATTLYDLLKIAFAVAAGVGGVIAQVTAYRRQRYIEFAHALADGPSSAPGHAGGPPALTAGSGRREHRDHRGITALLKRTARAGTLQPGQVMAGEHRHGLGQDVRGQRPGHRVTDLLLGREPLEELLLPAVLHASVRPAMPATGGSWATCPVSTRGGLL